MAHVISTLIAANFSIPSICTATVFSDAFPAGHVVTLFDPGWYRFWLVVRGNQSGDETTPYDPIQNLNTALAADSFTVSQTTAGLLTLNYSGTVTNGRITASNAIALAITGFNDTTFSGVSFGHTGSTTRTAAYPPSFCWLSFARTKDTGWLPAASTTAVAQMPDGKVYGWSNGYYINERTFNLQFMPRDQATKTLLATNPATPYFPTDTTSWLQPSVVVDVGTTAIQPWTALQMRYHMPTQRLAFCEDFQSMLTLANTAYDVVYLSPKTINAPFASTKPTRPGWRKLVDFEGVTLVKVTTESIDA